MFAAYLHQLPSRAVDELRLGKKAAEQLAEGEKLHKQVNQYSYGPPPVRFTESEVDQARAAGVLIEFENSQPIIVDRSLYRELAKQAIKRTVEQLRDDAERTKAERNQQAKERSSHPADPLDVARREHSRRTRELAEQAHGANIDLGWALMNNLAAVDPADMNVARLFVFALLGSDYDGSPYTQSGELIAELAMRGIRLVIEEFRTDATKTLKSGARGKLKIDYGDPKEPESAIKWLWRFIDGAKTAGELYGRALVVIAAEQHACRLALPPSQRFGVKRWPSHKDQAVKALSKLSGPHLPASLKQLEKAIVKANRELSDAQQARHAESRNSPTEGPAVTEATEDAEPDGEPMAEAEQVAAYEAAHRSVEHDDAAGAVGADGAVYSDAEGCV